MRARELGTAVLMCSAIALAGAACKKNTPPTENQSMIVVPEAEPVNAAGCLRAGMASDTFVLTTPAEQAGSPETSTYQLVGHSVDLRDHVGEKVSIAGTV